MRWDQRGRGVCACRVLCCQLRDLWQGDQRVGGIRPGPQTAEADEGVTLHSACTCTSVFCPCQPGIGFLRLAFQPTISTPAPPSSSSNPHTPPPLCSYVWCTSSDTPPFPHAAKGTVRAPKVPVGPALVDLCRPPGQGRRPRRPPKAVRLGSGPARSPSLDRRRTRLGRFQGQAICRPRQRKRQTHRRAARKGRELDRRGQARQERQGHWCVLPSRLARVGQRLPFKAGAETDRAVLPLILIRPVLDTHRRFPLLTSTTYASPAAVKFLETKPAASDEDLAKASGVGQFLSIALRMGSGFESCDPGPRPLSDLYLFLTMETDTTQSLILFLRQASTSLQARFLLSSSPS